MCATRSTTQIERTALYRPVMLVSYSEEVLIVTGAAEPLAVPDLVPVWSLCPSASGVAVAGAGFARIKVCEH